MSSWNGLVVEELVRGARGHGMEGCRELRGSFGERAENIPDRQEAVGNAEEVGKWVRRGAEEGGGGVGGVLIFC
jgi:hypothetical protein